MIEKNIRLEPHHSRDLLVGRRSDGRRPGYQPPGHRDAPSPSRSSDRGGHAQHATANVTARPDPTPAAPDRQDRARQQAVVEKKHQEATAIAEYAIREAKRIKETKPAHLGDTGGSLLTKKPEIDTGPKKDILPEFKKRKTTTITGGNPFLEDPYEKKIVYEPREGPARTYDPRTDPNALLKRGMGLGTLAKGVGAALAWPLASAFAPKELVTAAKWAKRGYDFKKGKYDTALNKLGINRSNLTSTIDKAKAAKFRDERTTLGKEDIEAWERKQDWSDVKPPKGGDGDGVQPTLAQTVTQGKGLQSGQELLGMDDKQIQQIYQGRDLLKQTIESGMYQDRKLTMDEIKMLQAHMMKMENLIQAIEKAQAPVNVAYGGRIDKALGGRSRDI